MSANIPTFEEVNKHIESADLGALEAAARKAGAAGATGEALPNICPAYKVVGPILEIVAGLPILPKKWKDAINSLCQCWMRFVRSGERIQLVANKRCTRTLRVRCMSFAEIFPPKEARKIEMFFAMLSC